MIKTNCSHPKDCCYPSCNCKTVQPMTDSQRWEEGVDRYLVLSGALPKAGKKEKTALCEELMSLSLRQKELDGRVNQVR